MLVAGQLPKLTWQEFLESAPYFLEAMWPALDRDRIPRHSLAPHIRALFYYDVFQAEACNGGIAQYIFNKADTLPEFDRAPNHVAAYPLLEDALPFMEEAHEYYRRIRQDYRNARDHAVSIELTGDEQGAGQRAFQFYRDHEKQTDDLNNRFYAVCDAIGLRINREIVKEPRKFFDISDPPMLKRRGVEYVNADRGDGVIWRLRFYDGFPEGPNIREDLRVPDSYRMVRFSADRIHLDYDSGTDRQKYFEQNSVDFRTGVAVRRTFRQGRLDQIETRRLDLPIVRNTHGIIETYDADGTAKLSQLYLSGDEYVVKSAYDTGQTAIIRFRDLNGPRMNRNFFPNGQINTESETLADGRSKYKFCYDENGIDLAPDGTGEYRHYGGIDWKKRAVWTTGKMVNGFLHGDVTIMRGSEIDEIRRFEDGVLKDKISGKPTRR